MPMLDALAVEEVYKRRYVEWQVDLASGSARAMCALVWLIWRRDGRDVPFENIISGKVPLDADEIMAAIIESVNVEGEAAPDPTTPGTPPGPDGTPTTGTATSASSPNASTSAPGKSGSSKSRTSRP
jgi:hypothetical protein